MLHATIPRMGKDLYSFVIVDDEPEIREGIRDNIRWEDFGFRFAGAWSNGVEALEACSRQAPDVLMTDINMPFMDGLALSERLLETAPSTKVLILTGYDDFGYARTALRLHVNDFILKPVTPSEFKATLTKLKEKLDAERAESRDLELLKKQLQESLPLLKERFLNSLLWDISTGPEPAERIAYLDLPLPAHACAWQVMAVDHERSGNNQTDELELLAERNLIQRTLDDSYPHMVFQDREGRVIILAWGEGTGQLYHESLKASEQLRERIARAGGSGVLISLGEAVEGMARVPRSYQDALGALAWGRMRGSRGMVAYRESLGGRTASGADAALSRAAWLKTISTALKTASAEDAVSVINEMTDAFKSGAFGVGEYRLTLQLALASVLQAADELGIAAAELFSTGEDPFARLHELTSPESARLWFSGIVVAFIQSLSSRQEKFAASKVREACEYMESNYADPDLSLPGLCKDLYISASYFSAVFRKLQDMTFVEYLTDLRIRKAMELLRTSAMKSYEIAELVGYRDAHYFSVSFRKITGITPTSYRNGNGSDHEEE